MTKKLIWRLKESPSVESVSSLVEKGIITKDEAKDILFSSESEKERDVKSLEAEIKFLRELVERLSNSQTTRVVEVIKEVQRPWVRWDWYKPYEIWCSTSTQKVPAVYSVTANMTNGTNMVDTSSHQEITKAFSSIKTF